MCEVDNFMDKDPLENEMVLLFRLKGLFLIK